jgi:hypothetical protein
MADLLVPRSRSISLSSSPFGSRLMRSSVCAAVSAQSVVHGEAGAGGGGGSGAPATFAERVSGAGQSASTGVTSMTGMTAVPPVVFCTAAGLAGVAVRVSTILLWAVMASARGETAARGLLP